VAAPAQGIVVFGDVVDSRRGAARSTRFLRTLKRELGELYPPGQRLAPVAFTQGDELQLLLAADADPFLGVVHAGVHEDALPMRWAIVAGSIDPGHGPATERTGQAFLDARAWVERAKARRERLAARTGDDAADEILERIGNLLPVLLADLTDRQRAVARLLLVEGLRRADAADRLAVSRATISVMADRAHVRELGGLAEALALVFRAGIEAGRAHVLRAAR
jgi:hypothetical protein